MARNKTGDALFGLMRFVGVGLLSQIALEALGFKWPNRAPSSAKQEALPTIGGAGNTRRNET